MNDENLNPITSEREAREKGKIGGVASAASRRKRKAMQEVWEVVRKMPVKAGDSIDIERIQSVAELKGANITVEQAMILAVAKKAMSGDVRAFETLSRLTDTKIRIDEIAAEMSALELEKLRIEVEAYRRIDNSFNAGVSIMDDIPN